MIIPRVIFQTSILKPPDYLVERICSRTIGWEYKHFVDEDIINYIKLNPIEDFPNCIDIFHSLQIGAHKADFFRYYFLYVNGGVFMDSDAILEDDLENIVNELEFFTVQSYMDNKSMFNGFIGSIPKNPIIYQAIQHIYFEKKENINTDYFIICKELFTIIKNYGRITKSILDVESFSKKNSIFIEEIIDDKIAVTKKDEKIILTHYFNKIFFIPSLNPISKIIEKKSCLKIGITLDLPEEVIQFFTNGIRQNVLYLGELFLNIGYNVSFIVMDKNIESCKQSELKKIFYHEDFKITKNSEILSSNFDLIIVIGYEIPLLTLKILKYMQTKIIYYSCGNSYLIDSEKILYNQHKNLTGFPYFNKSNEKLYDEIWCIPQMFQTNKSYFQILYRSNCIEVPFIWSNKSIQLVSSCYGIEDKEELIYKKKENDSFKIAIFEPNLSIMKWCFPALLICENVYRNVDKNIIEKVFLNNIINRNETINDLNLDGLNKIVKSLDLFSDKKISIEGRYNTLFFMKNFADIAVSHQMNNPLNYLYLDLAWMGWPILHNASLCKDIGYYYEDFDYEMGSINLKLIIETHELNKEDYLIKNRKLIDRYLPSNLSLKNKYKNLIEKLFEER